MYIISAPASPVLGFMVDKTGKNITWVLCAVVTTLIAHMMLAFTFWNPWLAMVKPSQQLLHSSLWLIWVSQIRVGITTRMGSQSFARLISIMHLNSFINMHDLDMFVCCNISCVNLLLFPFNIPVYLQVTGSASVTVVLSV